MKAHMVALAFCTVLSGCATFGMSADNTAAKVSPASKEGAELYRGKYSFVRLEPREAGSAANQPQAINAARLSAALAALKVSNGEPLFLTEELEEIVPQLARGLERAKIDQDVVFAVSGKHKLLGLLPSRSVTSGRIFVADSKLNLIFGLVQTSFDLERPSLQPTKVFMPGSRLRVLAESSTVTGGAWLPPSAGRSDWLILPLDRMGEPFTAPAVRHSAAVPEARSPLQNPVATDPAVSDVERRLAINARLKQLGLVTEEEYQEKRRLILQDF